MNEITKPTQKVTGFADIAPIVREQTVKAVLTIITKLTDRTINGELLKQLAKTSNDEQAGIRTNTTICLGKIARNLGSNASLPITLSFPRYANVQQTRQKVLIAAFCRSLRDPFVHARNAALLAFAATSDLFNEDDCAIKVLPALCPMLIDKKKLVRDQASKTFDVYTQRVRKYANSLPDTAVPPSTAATVHGTIPRVETPQNDIGWAGWAVSSFTNKHATANGDIQTQSGNLQVSSGLGRPSSVSPRTDTGQPAFAAASASQLDRQVVTGPLAPVLIRTSTDQFFGEAQEEDDEVDEAWGDMADESFFDAPGQPPPVVDPEALAPTALIDDKGEPDFEGWLRAQSQAKTKTPLPKGLIKPSGRSGGRQVATRSTTTGPVGSGSSTKKLASTATASRSAAAQAIDTQPKEPSPADDDWGDAWD
ncbi:MAG: hypothetical protein Q9193_001887 [Seirophora villosa]